MQLEEIMVVNVKIGGKEVNSFRAEDGRSVVMIPFDAMVTVGLAFPSVSRSYAFGVVEKFTNPFRSSSARSSHCRASSIASGTHTVLPSMEGYVPQSAINSPSSPSSGRGSYRIW